MSFCAESEARFYEFLELFDLG